LSERQFRVRPDEAASAAPDDACAVRQGTFTVRTPVRDAGSPLSARPVGGLMHRGVIACVGVLDDLRTSRPIGVFSVLDVADALPEEGDR
jgi:hypothetical protein